MAKHTNEFAVLALMETVAQHSKLENLSEGIFKQTAPTGLMALNIPMVLPESIDKNTAMKLAFIQQGRLLETIHATLGAEIANSKFAKTKSIVKKFMTEEEEYCRTLSLEAKKQETLQEKEGDIDGVGEFTSRRSSTGIAKSPYVFISFKFNRRTSVVPMATTLGFGNVEEVQLKVGLRVYSIFEDTKKLADETIKIFDRKDKFHTLWGRLRKANRNKSEMSILDVLRGRDVKVQRKGLKSDLASKDLGLILSKVLVQDKSWLSSLEKTKIGGSIVLTTQITDYLEAAGYDILNDPFLAKQFLNYSKAYDLYILDEEMDSLSILDKNSFVFQPYSLSSLIDSSKATIRKAEITFS